MRTTLTAMALGLLGIAGCAPTRPFQTAGVPVPAAKPNGYNGYVVDRGPVTGSPYATRPPLESVSTVVTNSAMPPAVERPTSAASSASAPVTPAPTAAAPNAVAPAVAPTATTTSAPAPTVATPVAAPTATKQPAGAAPVVAETPDRLPDAMPATSLPEPAKPRPVESVPQRPSIPEGPIEVHEVGQTPELTRTPEHRALPTLADPPAPAPVRTAADATVSRRAVSEQILSGTVETWRKTWRLRYAAPDVEDVNGGRVTLIGVRALERLHDGQHIRVRGTLIPASDRASPPIFEVLSVETVD